MTQRVVETLVIAAIALAAGACASERYVRESTQVVADHVASLKADIARFAQGQEASAGRRIDTVTRQRRRLAQGTDELTAQLKKSGARDLFDDALDEAARRIDAERARVERAASERKALRDSQTKIGLQAVRDLDTLAVQLKELADQPEFKERAKFLVDYVKRTKKEVDKLNDDAKAAEKDAKQPQ